MLKLVGSNMLDGGRFLCFVSISIHTLNLLKALQELEIVISFSVISFLFISNINSFVKGSPTPIIIFFRLFVHNYDLFFIKKSKHPLSHNSPINNNACFKSWKRWTVLASNGRSLLGNQPIFVHLMISPDGNYTTIGIVAFLYWSLLIRLALNFPLFLNLLSISEYNCDYYG